MKKIVLLIWSVSAVLFACQNPAVQTNKNEEIVKKPDSISHHEEGHVKRSKAVLLDNGKKWVANAETSEGIKKMLELTEAFPDHAELHDYHSMKEKLETEFNLFLKKCTMTTGEAHNQLHNYLLPMYEMLEGLNSPDIEVCEKSMEALRQHLNAYENFFM